MEIFKRFRKVKNQTTKKSPKNVLAIQRHKTRVDNLNEEYVTLSAKLISLESEKDSGVLRSELNKEVDAIIFRMAIIKYEVDVREDLLKWLSS